MSLFLLLLLLAALGIAGYVFTRGAERAGGARLRASHGSGLDMDVYDRLRDHANIHLTPREALPEGMAIDEPIERRQRRTAWLVQTLSSLNGTREEKVETLNQYLVRGVIDEGERDAMVNVLNESDV